MSAPLPRMPRPTTEPRAKPATNNHKGVHRIPAKHTLRSSTRPASVPVTTTQTRRRSRVTTTTRRTALRLRPALTRPFPCPQEIPAAISRFGATSELAHPRPVTTPTREVHPTSPTAMTALATTSAPTATNTRPDPPPKAKQINVATPTTHRAHASNHRGRTVASTSPSKRRPTRTARKTSPLKATTPGQGTRVSKLQQLATSPYPHQRPSRQLRG